MSQEAPMVWFEYARILLQEGTCRVYLRQHFTTERVNNMIKQWTHCQEWTREKSWAELTWVWAADEGADDEDGAQSHQTKPTVWHLSHSLLGARPVRPRASLSVSVCVWRNSIASHCLSRAGLRFFPALRNQSKWLFNRWQHNKVNDWKSLLVQTCCKFSRKIW